MKGTSMGRLSFKRRLGPAVSAVLASALLGAPTANAAKQDVAVSQPWIRFLVPGMPAAGYFMLQNNGSRPAVLTGAASPECGQLMLHESTVENSTAHMRMVMSIVVPAHGTVRFQPGGYHLMCVHPTATMAPGRSAPVTLRFKDGSSLSTEFPVYGPKGK